MQPANESSRPVATKGGGEQSSSPDQALFSSDEQDARGGMSSYRGRVTFSSEQHLASKMMGVSTLTSK